MKLGGTFDIADQIDSERGDLILRTNLVRVRELKEEKFKIDKEIENLVLFGGEIKSELIRKALSADKNDLDTFIKENKNGDRKKLESSAQETLVYLL